MRPNWPFFNDSDWLILVSVHSAKPTAELENLAMSPSLYSPGLSYDTKFVHIGLELRSSSVGDTILGVQSEPACMVVFICVGWVQFDWFGLDWVEVLSAIILINNFAKGGRNMETKHVQSTVDDINGWLQARQKTKTKQTNTPAQQESPPRTGSLPT